MRNAIERTVLVAMLLLALTASGRAGDTPEPQRRAVNRYVPRPAAEAVLDKPTIPTLTKAEPLDSLDIPLPPELIAVLVAECGAEGVPLEIALSVMEQESGFDQDATSPSGCYGLMQLNPVYFPRWLTPAENIKAGIGYLGELLARYNTTDAALTAYYYGPSDRASSWYSDDVLVLAEHWKEVLSE